MLQYVDNERGFILPLLGFLGQAATVATAVSTVGKAFAQQPPGMVHTLGGVKGVSQTLYSAPGGVNGGALAIPGGMAPPKSLPEWLKDIFVKYGPQIAEAMWQEFQKRRRSGQSSAAAKAAIIESYPITGKEHTARRRMNPTNIRALRRAVRRVRSFQRATRKVQRLFPRATRGGHSHYHRHRRRRGDLDPFHVEDMADAYDTAEDLGYEPDFFPEEERCDC